MTTPGTVLHAGDIAMDGTQFLHKWNLQFQAKLLENFQVMVQKAEAGKYKHQKDTDMRGNKTPFGPEKQSELRVPTWYPLGLEVPFHRIKV